MPQDRQVYSEINRDSWTYMPSLVRWRHRYRGVRESQKVNQEINQLLYDLYEIKTILDNTLNKLEVVHDEQYLGKEDFVEVDYYDGLEDEVKNYTHFGIDELIERISGIEKAIREMENNV